eukprot:99363-Amphidinium_carterae.1
MENPVTIYWQLSVPRSVRVSGWAPAMLARIGRLISVSGADPCAHKELEVHVPLCPHLVPWESAWLASITLSVSPLMLTPQMTLWCF